MRVWGDLVRMAGRKVEGLRCAVLRVLAGARHGRRSVLSIEQPPARSELGPPPHWVERVRRGAPGLLEPSARERVEAPMTVPPSPIEPPPSPVAPPSLAGPSVAKPAEPSRRPRFGRRRAQPTPMHNTLDHAYPPEAVAVEATPVPRTVWSSTVMPNPRPAPRAAKSATRQDVDPTSDWCPTPAVSDTNGSSVPAPESTAGAAELWLTPVVPDTSDSSVPAPASTAPAPERCLTPPVSDTKGLTSPVEAAHRRARSVMREARSGHGVGTPSLWPTRPRALARDGGAAPVVDRDLAEAPPLPAVESTADPLVAHPWPDLPAPVPQHDVDLDVALRAWGREQRLDREQARL